jgi:hypothetical protein
MIAVPVMVRVVAMVGLDALVATGMAVMLLSTLQQKLSLAYMATFLMVVFQSGYIIKLRRRIMSKITRYVLFFGGLLAVAGVIAVVLAVQADARIYEQPLPPTLAPESIDEQVLTPKPRVPREKIIKGTIVAVDGDTIMIDSSKYGSVTLHLSDETRIWKGKWNSELPIEVGDFFYGYGEPNEDRTIWKMEQMEVNIVNLRGGIISIKETSEGLTLQLEEAHDNQLYTIHVTPETLLMSDDGRDVPFSEAQVDLKLGDGVQIIGLKRKDGTVVATSIF